MEAMLQERAGWHDNVLPPRDDVTALIQKQGATQSEIMAAALQGYADRPALARRRYEVVADPQNGGRIARLLPEFETISYRETWQAVQEIATAWQTQGVVMPGRDDIVGLLGASSPEYVMLDLAVIYSGAVLLPLPTNLAPQPLSLILAETAAPCLGASAAELELAVEALLLSGHVPAQLLVFEYDSALSADAAALASALERLREAGLPTEVLTLADLRARAGGLPVPSLYVPQNAAERLATVYYTSGSTGAPKGAMYLEHHTKPVWLPAVPGSQVLLHYLPLSHSYGRSFICLALARGGISYFTARSDLSTLLEDMALTRPTNLPLVPRVCELLHQRFNAEFDRRRTPGCDEAALRKTLIDEMRVTLLGGRVAQAVMGAAPTAPELWGFMEALLGYKPANGYGATELGMVAVSGQVMNPPVRAYKLVDVPELGYFTTDLPYPRGELRVKSDRCIPGYFKRPDLTAQMFDKDGFYKTGDIMAETAPGQIAYLDRVNNVLKLAQGEFVAIAQLEATYIANHRAIRQIFIYGNSSRSFLLAVIVPNRTVLPEGLMPPGVETALREALRDVAAKQGLNAYEVPRGIIVEDEPFSTENGLLAGLGKVLRPAFLARYGARLEQIYADMANAQEAELRSLRAAVDGAPVLEVVIRAAKASLGLASIDPSGAEGFAALGGDSLSALAYALLLEEMFGMPIEVGTIMHPAGTLLGLAADIEARRGAAGHLMPTANAVHGAGFTVLRAADLTLDKFIGADVLRSAGDLPPADTFEPRTVLLTGANGYLGRFLCLEWLERAARTGAKIICVVRGHDDANARERLLRGFETGDAVLMAHVQALSARLEVLAGDLAAPRLGLSETAWAKLAAEVDVIVHPAALVNHKLPYSQLFGPNVGGTAVLIELALCVRKKRFVLVSTVAAAGRNGHYIAEDAPIIESIPAWTPGESYADGYAASKWAGEVLLLEAYRAFGIPCAVFRSDMILAHSRYAGQINVPDMFTRWMLSIIETGLAPRSFYRETPGVRPHYDGIPVDFTARSIVEIAEARRAGHETFHLVNAHDDGISMDRFIEWIEAAGCPIRRVEDYSDWFVRFEVALRALPTERRQATVLPLLHGFSQPGPAVAGSDIPCARLEDAVTQLHVGEGMVPHIEAGLIQKCVMDLRGLGLIRED